MRIHQFTSILLVVLSSAASAFTTTTTRTMTMTMTTTSLSATTSASYATVQAEIDDKLAFLKSAAETRQQDSEQVITALVDLEKLSRQAANLDETYAQEMLQNLHGSWRLVFTTGTVNTQKKYGKINYFPLKAVQSFNTTDWTIENGIYLGDSFCALKFAGTFGFDLIKRKLEFDFDQLSLLQFLDIGLGKGQAASLGARSGLGSESNVANAARDKSAFFNWISADASIATARGGGGGLALWKRVTEQ